MSRKNVFITIVVVLIGAAVGGVMTLSSDLTPAFLRAIGRPAHGNGSTADAI
jgi:hypothetical protein